MEGDGEWSGDEDEYNDGDEDDEVTINHDWIRWSWRCRWRWWWRSYGWSRSSIREDGPMHIKWDGLKCYQVRKVYEN